MITYGFIFARGGSKGLPGKNVKLLCGKPLICYSIETAKQVTLIDEVFVSTDDKEISEVASAVGAIVIDRPKELASDTSSEWMAWRHAIEWVTAKYGKFDEFVSLPATSPLRSTEDVEAALVKRAESQADICISVTPASRSPYFNMVTVDKNGAVALVNKPNGEIFRRQDAPNVFDITTVVYATTPNFVMNHVNIFDGKVVSIEVPKVRAADIDDIYDFKFAEAVLNFIREDES